MTTPMADVRGETAAWGAKQVGSRLSQATLRACGAALICLEYRLKTMIFSLDRKPIGSISRFAGNLWRGLVAAKKVPSARRSRKIRVPAL